MVFYEEMERLKLRPGLYVFTDVELMDEACRARAAALRRRLLAEPGLYQVWNDPERSTRRFDLLERLWIEGRNTFRAFRLAPGPTPPVPSGMRYPVFVRDEHLHRGPLTGLLKDEAEVKAALAELRAPGGQGVDTDLLVVEFLDYASADGVYRKYSYMRMGADFYPKHVLYNNHWSVKHPKAGQFDFGPWLAEEWVFLRERPHEEEIRRLFDECGIDFGRVDYTVVNGKVQVFEMNSNPTVFQTSFFKPISRRPVHEWFREHYARIIVKNDKERTAPLLRRLCWRLRRPKVVPVPWWRAWQ